MVKIPHLPPKFEVLREIGSGGMAKVYLALNKETNQKVAIKTLLNDPNMPLTNKNRFKEELRLAKYISSPYVVKFYEGSYNADTQYLVMEYVEGKMLKDYIEEQGRLNVDEAVNFATQIAKGFSEIHAQNIVHRDLKTSNVMISILGEVKIIDFGIAISDDSVRYTQTGRVIGSVHYMAPEIVNQENATPQTDVYALGIMLFEMLIGEPPFKGKDALETALKHKKEEIKPVNQIFPSIPQALANVVAKATAKRKEDRYLSMRQLSQDLSTCLNQNRITEKKIELNTSSQKPKKDWKEFVNSRLFVIASVSFLAIVALIIVLVIALM
ncbi:MAG: serine/threonine protein kinase [Mycoplasmataceae bacterium]|nr:serine/threonine protein kinase [Mycoplasmataceae bacterium]